jgi:hypothetical protein
MRTVIALLMATALQAEPPKLSDALLKERWKALAVHHSNTVRYLELQAELAKSKAAYDKAMADLKAACGKEYTVSDSGSDAACVAIPTEVKTK